MRPRFKADVVCSATPSGKCFFNKAVKLPKKVKNKKPHIKCFDKLVPITVAQALVLVSTTDIYMV